MKAVYDSDKVKEWFDVYHRFLNINEDATRRYLRFNYEGDKVDDLKKLLDSAKEIPKELRDAKLESRIASFQDILDKVQIARVLGDREEEF